MSKNMYRTENHKRIVSKADLLEEKENACSSQSAKCIKSKSGVERKKKFSVCGANCSNDATGSTTTIQKFAIGSKTQFQVYSDNNNGNEKSRSPMQKDTLNKKKIKRVKSRIQKTPLCTKYKQFVFEKEKPNPYSTTVVLHRPRSLSNQNRVYFKGDNGLTVESSRRACSEDRKSSYTRVTLYPSTLSISPKIQHLSNDVKKRTSCSIEMWKNKMRRSRIDTVRKNSSTAYSATTRTDEARARINLSNTHNIDFLPKSSRHDLNLARIETPASEILNIGETDRNENINNKSDCFLQNINNDAMKPYISSEFVTISPTAISLNAQADIGARLCTGDNNRQFTEKLSSNYTTPSNSSPIRSLASARVYYEQCCKVTNQFSTKKRDFQHNNQILCEDNYLIELPDIERGREESAPKLSSCFLRKNINAQQRRVIVGYLINLGVRYNYESSIIYQTVKLFDVAVDRISVNTDQIQLMALACLWIILKRELAFHKIPLATEILELAENMYKDQEECLLIYEKKILLALKFNIRFADPYSLITYYISNLDGVAKNISQYDILRIYFCSSYLIDICMLDESLCVISIFVLAITAFELSLDFILASKPNINQTWCQSLRNQNTLAIWEEKQMSFVKQIMIKLVLESNISNSRIVYKKYRRSRCCRVSEFVLENIKQTIHKYDIE